MEPFKFPFFTLIVLAVGKTLLSVHCQICNLKNGELPQDWKCDGEPHIHSKDKNELDRYCGFTISSTLPKELTENISNGRPALLGELPFVAAIAYKGRHLCGATLIDNYHLVTAAHCVLLVRYLDPNGNGLNPADLKVQMGTIYRYGTKAAEDDINTITRDVANIHRHRNYEQGYVDRTTRKEKKGGYGGSDLAVLTLVEPMPFTRNTWPVCLGSKELLIGVAFQRNSPMVVTGFGQDKDRDIKNVQLQLSKEMRLLEEDNCEKSINDLGYEFHPGQICAAGVKEEKTAGACKGDSGGALSQEVRGRHYMLGLVSYGPGDCLKDNTTNPDVYTDTRYFQSWIDGITTKWQYSTYLHRGKISIVR